MQLDPGSDSGGGQCLNSGCLEGETTGFKSEVDGGCEGYTKSRRTSKTLARDHRRGMPPGKVGRNLKSGQGSSGCLVGFKETMHVECWRGYREPRENPE